MKKSILILASAALLAGSASAQQSIVKSALKAVSPSASIEQLQNVIATLQPALTNAETQNDAATWFALGKAQFSLYDQLNAQSQMGKIEADPAEMGNALLGGLESLQKALPLDSVVQVDKKTGAPKIDKKTGAAIVKTKYSNEILQLISSHAPDFGNVANACVSAQKWPEAAKAFAVYGEQLKITNPELPDTVMGEIYFFEGYSAYNAATYEPAFKAFTKAVSAGYTANNVNQYQYASLGNFAQECLEKNEMAKAHAIIDNAIAQEPNNSMFYNLKGILVERESDLNAAVVYFQKAIELDANNSQAQFNVGRYYYNQAAEFVKNNPNATLGDVKPLYDKSLPYLEKAYELDNNNTDAKNALRQLYYQFQDAEKYKALTGEDL